VPIDKTQVIDSTKRQSRDIRQNRQLSVQIPYTGAKIQVCRSLPQLNRGAISGHHETIGGNEAHQNQAKTEQAKTEHRGRTPKKAEQAYKIRTQAGNGAPTGASCSQRYLLLTQRYNTMPLLVVEDADAGRQLIDTIKSREPQIPLVAAKPVKAKIIRAEGVTPITTAGLVALPKDAPWRADFVKEMGDFPVGQHDDVTDAFCHAMKSFVTERDFKTPDLSVLPGRVVSEQELAEQEVIDELEYRNATHLGDGFGDDF
jgi:predicted phage terminase large subunit-like protein